MSCSAINKNAEKIENLIPLINVIIARRDGWCSARTAGALLLSAFWIASRARLSNSSLMLYSR